jgi:hypothetical protein
MPGDSTMPSKLKLNLDQLTVDSFETAKDAPRAGTVFGEQCTCYTNCTCPGCPSCDATCPLTCDYTCEYTCETCDFTCSPCVSDDTACHRC